MVVLGEKRYAFPCLEEVCCRGNHFENCRQGYLENKVCFWLIGKGGMPEKAISDSLNSGLN